jgi:hypothetical protein
MKFSVHGRTGGRKLLRGGGGGQKFGVYCLTNPKKIVRAC